MQKEKSSTKTTRRRTKETVGKNAGVSLLYTTSCRVRRPLLAHHFLFHKGRYVDKVESRTSKTTKSLQQQLHSLQNQISALRNDPHSAQAEKRVDVQVPGGGDVEGGEEGSGVDGTFVHTEEEMSSKDLTIARLQAENSALMLERGATDLEEVGILGDKATTELKEEVKSSENAHEKLLREMSAQATTQQRRIEDLQSELEKSRKEKLAKDSLDEELHGEAQKLISQVQLLQKERSDDGI